MAELPSTYTEHAEEIEPAASFDAIPAGKYPAYIKDSEWKDTKAGDGRYLQFCLEVTDGESKGRLLWDRLNLENQNETAVEIAHRTLSAICHACGKISAKDSTELHNTPMLVRVGVKDGPNGPTNVIKGYEAMEGEIAEPKATPTKAPAKRPAKATPPWTRK
jgi:hypothetical protein